MSQSLSQNRLYIVGIGPGSIEHLTKKAHDVLLNSEYILGNGTYLDHIKELSDNSKVLKKVIRSGMGGEVERAKMAVELSKNHVVSIVSGGDANVYGMAGLVFEIAEKSPYVKIEVISGVTALSAAASLIGAPIVNDFAVISLSDLLTPFEVIEKRLKYSCEADFVIAIYNPKSKLRKDNFKKAVEIIRNYKKDDTPVGIVKNATRDGEVVITTTLGKILEHNDEIDMRTTVIIGNSEARLWNNIIITPRGYQRKYEY